MVGLTANDSGALDERRLRKLIDVGRSLVAELDPEVVLSRVLEVACELTGARYAALGVLDSDRRGLERLVARGIDGKTREAIGSLPRGRGVLGLLIENPEPLRLSNVADHPRSYGFPPGHPPMTNFLGVPIVIRGRAWGNLYLAEKAGGEFDEADEQSALTLAEWTAIAVDNAQSVAEDKMRYSIEAAERERGRWARELHDEALQSMGGLRLLLSTARRGATEGGVEELLSQAIERVDHTIAEMRRLIADLRPATLDELGLAAALEALVERLTWGKVLDVELKVDLAYDAGRRPTRLLGQIEDTVYRLVQEALNNAARHSETDRATVEVTEAEESIQVRIEDDGRGFDPGDETDGFGLRGMRERVALTGGTLEVRSAPGAGTAIAATLPARHRQGSPGATTTRESDEAGNRTAEGR
jgi:signal transduction histidine kinase